VTLIGVKSKYGSCSGNCTGLININNYVYVGVIYSYLIKINNVLLYMCTYRKVPFVGMTDWYVNYVALSFFKFKWYSKYLSIKYVIFAYLQEFNSLSFS